VLDATAQCLSRSLSFGLIHLCARPFISDHGVAFCPGHGRLETGYGSDDPVVTALHEELR